jgi:hypothetical protein
MHANLKNSAVKIQYVTALVLLWAFGIVIFVYLLFNFQSITLPDSFSFTTKFTNTFSNNKADTLLSENDAYVFINVNKKHFLTRFVASVYEGTSIEFEKKKNKLPILNLNPTVERVTKKIKQDTISKTPDFIIKQAPGI